MRCGLVPQCNSPAIPGQLTGASAPVFCAGYLQRPDGGTSAFLSGEIAAVAVHVLLSFTLREQQLKMNVFSLTACSKNPIVHVT
jgi:hypothetical protein